jgi:hypothetical protein
MLGRGLYLQSRRGTEDQGAIADFGLIRLTQCPQGPGTDPFRPCLLSLASIYDQSEIQGLFSK